MAYTNSKLVNYTRISPNRSVNRNHKIDTIEHFERNYRAYRIKEGALFFDEAQATAIQMEEENEQLRVERDAECFSVINRGWLWYDTLTEKQTKELRKWYKDWLDVTETRKKPDKPSWLK